MSFPEDKGAAMCSVRCEGNIWVKFVIRVEGAFVEVGERKGCYGEIGLEQPGFGKEQKIGAVGVAYV